MYNIKKHYSISNLGFQKFFIRKPIIIYIDLLIVGINRLMLKLSSSPRLEIQYLHSFCCFETLSIHVNTNPGRRY
ncbi:putative F ORF F [Vaccinia virus Copenhagen]|uniref:Uncharacterized 8.8 kDa protein n=2 Tax=Vaccinia virus TaxID=10245 RepID=YVFF_VACCC|nr:RecName: Full=Uncharacterized 8.8 kDa protein [Vaccinia virus Copenhagen]AGJ91484.1 hypothetical protein VACV_TT9_064 [Vaccinia virus]AAA48033.1 putative F ORF F [Vaccinia virus Copenhagen]AGJ92301.1 hypothetical protein VACV_TT12_064 [Vaccinia virus]WDR17179.1 putative F ORF F [Vaccinia virus Copenhagen]WDR17390.1 putative F ORF F [Vaccinia virus Copenhagen]